MKLWYKGYDLDATIEKFTVGDDPKLDEVLIPYDCLGSMAHAKMLAKIGILSAEECQKLVAALRSIIGKAQEGRFVIQQVDEDVHTAVENELTNELGQLGKKLHTARSRNDQVLVDLRMYAKDQLLDVVAAVGEFGMHLCAFAEKFHNVPVPGRTHFQRAMPSSVGLLAGAFAESLCDDIRLLRCAFDLVDQCPLGSAASYGVALPIDRQYCADLLGFAKVQNNVLYANNSRGKFEGVILSALSAVMNDLSKLATDLILFSAPEFGYFILPENCCPGSSLMPQKRNPCPLELIRAKSATLQGMTFSVLEIVRSLPSGYNRDFQETKRPLIEGFDIVLMSLAVMDIVLSGIQVDKDRCKKAFSPELFATDTVLSLVQKGMPFREAYQAVAMGTVGVEEASPGETIAAKSHLGAPGNLQIPITRKEIRAQRQWVVQKQRQWSARRRSLEKG